MEGVPRLRPEISHLRTWIDAKQLQVFWDIPKLRPLRSALAAWSAGVDIRWLKIKQRSLIKFINIFNFMNEFNFTFKAFATNITGIQSFVC